MGFSRHFSGSLSGESHIYYVENVQACTEAIFPDLFQTASLSFVF
jgi:hypothetical protein